MSISISEARLALHLLNSKAIGLDRIDVFTGLTNAGIPPEITLRLEELWEKTKVVGGKVIHVGKIIAMEMLRFINANPHLVIGVALGAAVGALVNLVPYLGPMLAPLTMAVGAMFFGAIGSRVDRGKKPAHWAEDILQEVMILAKKFFALLADIFMALKADFTKNAKGELCKG